MIYADMSMSLDGFVAGPRVGVDNLMGDGGERLHEWMFTDEHGVVHLRYHPTRT